MGRALGALVRLPVALIPLYEVPPRPFFRHGDGHVYTNTMYAGAYDSTLV